MLPTQWVHCLLFLLFCTGSQAAVITGQFRNAFAGDKVEVFVPHYYIDGRSDTYRGELDAQLQFTLKAKVPEPQLVFLVFNEDRLPVFLAPDDTVIVRADAFKFPLVAAFGGPAGADNSLLQKYLKENLQDYNEFNNLRYKIGQWWASVEEPMSRQMETMPPKAFRDSLDRRKTAAYALLEDFDTQNPDAVTPAFHAWLESEILYFWAYHLLFYGHVYANVHQVQPDFFDFLYEAPTINDMIGSDWYRQYLLALLARTQAKTGQTDNFWAGQYRLAGNLLAGKPLAFFRSEMINIAFSGERYREILPLFNDFMQTNTQAGYDDKVADLYQKFVRVSPGAVAPVFEADNNLGETINLKQFHGRVVYLNFWASWCGSCIKKMELFNDWTPELNRAGVEIVNISVDADRLKWEDALAAWHFSGYNLLAGTGKPDNVAGLYKVEAVPQYFIIDKTGAFAEKALSSQPNDIRRRLLELSKAP